MVKYFIYIVHWYNPLHQITKFTNKEWAERFCKENTQRNATIEIIEI